MSRIDPKQTAVIRAKVILTVHVFADPEPDVRDQTRVGELTGPAATEWNDKAISHRESQGSGVAIP
jgi:hypothetical protein